MKKEVRMYRLISSQTTNGLHTFTLDSFIFKTATRYLKLNT